jgi:hypothetical protein
MNGGMALQLMQGYGCERDVEAGKDWVARALREAEVRGLCGGSWQA